MASKFEANSTTSIEMQLWQTAMPIQTARENLAPAELAHSFKATSKVSRLEEFLKAGVQNQHKEISGIEFITESMKASAPKIDEKWSNFHAMNDYFMEQFRRGSLRCFAFEFPRKIDSQPIEMRPEHWTDFPSWETGEFKANGFHLIELRVLKADEVSEKIETPQQVKLGRPTIKNHVEAAFEALLAEGHINTKISAKSHFPLIRN